MISAGQASVQSISFPDGVTHLIDTPENIKSTVDALKKDGCGAGKKNAAGASVDSKKETECKAAVDQFITDNTLTQTTAEVLFAAENYCGRDMKVRYTFVKDSSECFMNVLKNLADYKQGKKNEVYHADGTVSNISPFGTMDLSKAAAAIGYKVPAKDVTTGTDILAFQKTALSPPAPADTGGDIPPLPPAPDADDQGTDEAFNVFKETEFGKIVSGIALPQGNGSIEARGDVGKEANGSGMLQLSKLLYYSDRSAWYSTVVGMIGTLPSVQFGDPDALVKGANRGRITYTDMALSATYLRRMDALSKWIGGVTLGIQDYNSFNPGLGGSAKISRNGSEGSAGFGFYAGFSRSNPLDPEDPSFVSDGMAVGLNLNGALKLVDAEEAKKKEKFVRSTEIKASASYASAGFSAAPGTSNSRVNGGLGLEVGLHSGIDMTASLSYAPRFVVPNDDSSSSSRHFVVGAFNMALTKRLSLNNSLTYQLGGQGGGDLRTFSGRPSLDEDESLGTEADLTHQLGTETFLGRHTFGYKLSKSVSADAGLAWTRACNTDGEGCDMAPAASTSLTIGF